MGGSTVLLSHNRIIRSIFFFTMECLWQIEIYPIFPAYFLMFRSTYFFSKSMPAISTNARPTGSRKYIAITCSLSLYT